MNSDPSKLDDMEMLSLIAKGLIPFMERVVAGEKDPFPGCVAKTENGLVKVTFVLTAQ